MISRSRRIIGRLRSGHVSCLFYISMVATTIYIETSLVAAFVVVNTRTTTEAVIRAHWIW